MRARLLSTLAACLLAAGSALGAGGGGGGGPEAAEAKPSDPVIEAIEAAAAKSDWPRARELARDGVAKNTASADYHNMYAYTLRMGASPQMDLVFKRPGLEGASRNWPCLGAGDCLLLFHWRGDDTETTARSCVTCSSATCC